MKSLESEEKDQRLVEIGKKVRQLRKSNPDFINYEVFAFTHRINKVTLQRIERGDNYNIESLLKVLDALGVKISTFFSGID
jgi:transcriptional regulator with XRE-family HTH domain